MNTMRRKPLATMLAWSGTLLSLVFAVLWVFPLYWMVSTSLKAEIDTTTVPPPLIPQPFDLTAYTYILQNSPILRWYANSLITALIITFLLLFLSLLVAFALSQIDFPGKKWLFWIILAGFMIPFQTSLIPLFILVSKMGLTNQYAGIILPQLAAPLIVVIYKQFFDQVPRDLGDAARIDGASEFQVLIKVYLPLNWAITWALAIVSFIGAWDNFLWPFIVTNATSMLTIPVGITQTQSTYGIAYARTMASAVLAAIPTVIAFIFFQRRVTEGIMATSGIK